jgi:hypothetical protein
VGEGPGGAGAGVGWSREGLAGCVQRGLKLLPASNPLRSGGPCTRFAESYVYGCDCGEEGEGCVVW